jgi:alpha-tubulin suppressor-like RCC1 family protein
MKKIYFILIFTLINFLTNAQCFTAVNSGSFHNIAKKSNGSLWVWGAGAFGQLGNTGSVDVNSPIQLSTGFNWQVFKASNINTFAVKTDGTLWGTGSNVAGSMGTGTTQEYYPSLTQIGTANNWKTIAPSDYFTIAMKTDNTIWGWGQNDGYQMGNSSCCSDQLTPIQISTATDWKMIATSKVNNTFAIKTNGTLWCWGSNLSALLGDNLLSNLQIPTQHNTDTDWDKMSLGVGHILILKTNGTLWSWGGGGEGETGDGLPANYNRFEPLQIGTSTWKAVSGGFKTSFGIKTDGTLWAWGKNGVGQLGLGILGNQPFPIQVGTASNWESVSAGYNHTIALKTDGSMWAWGDDFYGQLGNGTNTSASIPTQIPVTGCTLGNNNFTVATTDFSINPNPSKGSTAISFTYSTAPQLVIYDVFGKQITQYTANEAKGTWQLDTSSIAAGVYIVVMKDASGILMQKKLVIE